MASAKNIHHTLTIFIAVATLMTIYSPTAKSQAVRVAVTNDMDDHMLTHCWNNKGEDFGTLPLPKLGVLGWNFDLAAKKNTIYKCHLVAGWHYGTFVVFDTAKDYGRGGNYKFFLWSANSSGLSLEYLPSREFVLQYRWTKGISDRGV